MRNLLIGLGVLAAAILAAALFAFSRQAAPAESPEDAAARRIADSCAMGFTETGKAGLIAELAPRLRALNSEAKVSSARVGAIVSTIGSDANGVLKYEAYRLCLKQQTEFALRERGILVEDPPPPRAEDAAGDPAPADGDKAAVRASRPAPPRVTNSTTGDHSPIISGSNIGSITNVTAPSSEPDK